MAIVDVYDGMISKRVYKNPFSHVHTVGIIKSEMGTHFDPDITKCFVGISDQFKEISLAFKDD